MCRTMPSVPRHLTCLILVVVALVAAGHATARTITVGNGGCQYIGLQFALDDLADEAGPHVIKLRTQTIAIPDGLVLNTSSTSYTFIGGHSSCSDASPTGTQRTVLDAAGGDNGTAFAINGNSGSATPVVILRGLTVRGGSSETGIGANPEGGGLEIRGRVTVQLAGATRIEANASGKGGGVYLRGTSASAPATLFILGDSRILDNAATTTGGGIHCEQHGDVLHDYGQVSFNAAQTGGGAYLRDTCGYDALVQAGAFTAIANNTAETSAGLVQLGGRPLLLRGAPNAPFWFIGNVAERDAAALLVSNSTARTEALLENVVMLGNRSGGGAGAAMILVGAVDATMRPRSGSSRCAFPGVGFGACSALVDNVQTAFAQGGVVHLWESVERESPNLTVRRTAFIDNRGLNLFGTYGPGHFDIESALITGTHLHAGSSTFPSALFWSSPDRYGTVPTPPLQRIVSSTIVETTRDGSNSVVFDHGRSPINLTGSIVHAPGLAGRNTASSGVVTHNGCLLVHEASGFPSSPAPPLVGAPGLDAALVPTALSPALDQCASTLVPGVDFHGSPRAVDQAGVPNRFGPVDLGAIERPADNDIIFRNGFD